MATVAPTVSVIVLVPEALRLVGLNAAVMPPGRPVTPKFTAVE